MEVPIVNWFEEPAKKSIESVFDGINDFVESLDLIGKYRRAHLEITRPMVSQIKILGMQQPCDLEKIYYPTAVSTDIRRRIYKPEWGQIDGKQQKDALAATKVGAWGDKYFEENPRTVILGGPGAGKTTFLRFIALAYCEKNIFAKTHLKSTCLPAYVHLPSIARDHIEIVDAIADPVIRKTDGRAKLFFERLIETGNCAVLLDSLDEVPVDQRSWVVDQINRLSKAFPKARVAITCRTADYQQVLEGFNEVEISKLTKQGIQKIVKAWFAHDEEKAEKLLSMLEVDHAVNALTETPLLLSLLCIQYKNDLALPKRKTELYRRCIDALLRDWDATRNFRRDTQYSQLSDDRKEFIFESVAGAVSKDKIEYEFPAPVLLGAISETIEKIGVSANESMGILKEIESHHGIIEMCSAETYQFSHGTMHEYFAARYFVAMRQELSVLKKHYQDDNWHTIFSFICAIMRDPGPVLEFLVGKSSTINFQNYPTLGKKLTHLLLLYRCMSMGLSIENQVRRLVCEHLVQSQIAMLLQLNSDGVLPYAARRQYGVRQTLFTFSKPRTSIEKLLLPYRSLMNEVFLSPIPEYSESVLSACHQISQNGALQPYSKIGVLTCLLAPISDAKPQEFVDWMFHCSSELLRLKGESVRSFVVESIAVHRKIHPSIEPSSNDFSAPPQKI